MLDGITAEIGLSDFSKKQQLYLEPNAARIKKIGLVLKCGPLRESSARQLHPCARRCMTVPTWMALQQRPQSSERNSKDIHGWPCMSDQTLRRPIDLYDGWGPANWSVRRGLGGRRHGRLDLLVNISIVFTILT